MTIYNWKYLPKTIDAMVIYPVILTRFNKKTMPASLRRHEEEHLKQARRYWVVGFYLLYLLEYVKGRLQGKDHYAAYYDISFEREARYAERHDL